MSSKIYELAKIVNLDRFSIGDYSQVDDFVFINAGQKTSIGRFVHVACFCSVVGGGVFEMEDFSGLSSGCRIVTGSDDFLGGGMTNPTVPAEFLNVKKSFVSIGKHAIIGSNAVILPGVRVGEGAAVGAGCIVRKDLEPWTIYAGFDCKPIKARNNKIIEEYERELMGKVGKC